VSDDVGWVISACLFRTARHFGKIGFDPDALLCREGITLTVHVRILLVVLVN
jgi:hypothetical protein